MMVETVQAMLRTHAKFNQSTLRQKKTMAKQTLHPSQQQHFYIEEDTSVDTILSAIVPQDFWKFVYVCIYRSNNPCKSFSLTKRALALQQSSRFLQKVYMNIANSQRLTLPTESNFLSSSESDVSHGRVSNLHITLFILTERTSKFACITSRGNVPHLPSQMYTLCIQHQFPSSVLASASKLIWLTRAHHDPPT